ncbi:MAG: c-type cytochrome [Acidobacteria bacterium]|nr:c-type cytochrome [Acidobacteriota bacterium]
MRILAFLVAAGLAAQQTPPPKPLPASAADLEQGGKLYRGSCGYCHGPQGDGGKGADLSKPKLEKATSDEKLVNIIQNGIPGTEMPGAWHMIDNEVRQVAAFVRTLGKVESKPVPGDREKGKAVYAKAGCAGCHSIRESGRPVGSLNGPELSVIGSRRSAAHLRESLLEPAASVPDGYLIVTAVPVTGAAVTGTRLSEDTFTLALRDFGGRNHVFVKTALKDIRKEPKKSAMPSFRGKLSADELQDLIAYLASLKEPS